MPSELEKGIMRYADNRVDNAPYITIETGLIIASTPDGYTVRVGNVEYANVGTLSATSHLTNDTVKVVMYKTDGRCDNMFILGKLKLV